MSKTTLLLLALIAAVVLIGVMRVPHQSMTPQADSSMMLRYHFDAEAVYRDIEIEDSTLTYTFFEDTQNKCARWIAQMPCWTKEDLQTVHAPLTAAELHTLRDLIEETHFMNLEDTYGNAGQNPGARYYSTVFTVEFGTAEKTVTYESFLNGEPMPSALQQMEAYLLYLVKNQFHK
jgi:hypothetical protein